MVKNLEVLRNYNFMVVDDHAYVCSMLEGVLRRFGCSRSVKAGSIGEAMEMFRLLKANPGKLGVSNLDIVFVDYRLSGEGRSGWDLVKFIRRSPESFNRFVRIVGMTAFADADVLKEGRDAGLNSMLVKPFTSRTVYNQVFDTIRDERPYVELVDGSYFGPERYANRKPIDRDEKGRFFPGVKVEYGKKISQKIGSGKDLEVGEDIFASSDEAILAGVRDKKEELKDLVLKMQEEYRAYKASSREEERVVAMKGLSRAAHSVRDSDGMFLHPLVGKAAAYVERLGSIEGVTEHRHTVRILEGLLGLQLLLLSEKKGMSHEVQAATIFKELEKLMKVIAESLSSDAEDFFF